MTDVIASYLPLVSSSIGIVLSHLFITWSTDIAFVSMTLELNVLRAGTRSPIHF